MIVRSSKAWVGIANALAFILIALAIYVWIYKIPVSTEAEQKEVVWIYIGESTYRMDDDLRGITCYRHAHYSMACARVEDVVR